MVSTMVRAVNDSSALIVISVLEQATFIQIDTSEECQLKSNYFDNSLCTIIQKMSTTTRRNSRPSSISTGEETSTRRAILTVALIFLSSLTALFYVYTNFPELEEHEKKHMKLPLHIEDAKNLGRLLERYKELYYAEVLAGVFITYIFLQTFAIPGSIFLSILSGFLFPFYLALLLVCTCSAVGASLCYLLSSLLGRKLLFKYFPDRANQWAQTVREHKDNLFNYMLFLRMTPLFPNWFINLASPVIGVPMIPFSLGTFFGVAPPSFLAIQAGQTLNKLTSSSDTWSWSSMIVLCIFAVLSLVPVYFKDFFNRLFKRLRLKFD
ncbi:transmembrane protein 41 homolog [Diachasma alloeum]|uniref:transmembrane protein 41 homolog n=1 Tax=Diachasma alloeum TaxID=454923 RepID=UPI00073835C5|nr:transmembrane protein 41 homolog [Diachasma alloeum]